MRLPTWIHLTEKFFDGIPLSHYDGRYQPPRGEEDAKPYVEIYKNPTPTELARIATPSEFGSRKKWVGAVLTPTGIYMWNRDQAYHDTIIPKLTNIRGPKYPLYLYYVPATMRGVLSFAPSSYKSEKYPRSADMMKLVPASFKRLFTNLIFEPTWTDQIEQELGEGFFRADEIHGRYVEVFKNPSIREFTSLIKNREPKESPMRGALYAGGVISPTGFYVWDRAETYVQHHDMIKFLNDSETGIGTPTVPLDVYMNPSTRILSVRLAIYSMKSLGMDEWDFPKAEIESLIHRIPNSFSAFAKVDVLETQVDN